MNFDQQNSRSGFFERLRNRGFWAYFAFVTALVFILLTIFDFALPLAYGLDQPSLDFDLLWDIGVNIAISALSAAIAWKTNGDRWINRPDTIKLDLDE